MNIAPLTNHVSAADVPLERLAGNRNVTEEQKISEASRQFEALLLRQILQQTQKTVIKSKYSDDSTAAGIYHDMVSSQLADTISKSGDVGLAKTLGRQLNGQLHPTSPSGLYGGPKALPTAQPVAGATRPLDFSAYSGTKAKPHFHKTVATPPRP